MTTRTPMMSSAQITPFGPPAVASLADIAALVPAPETSDPAGGALCSTGRVVIYLAGCDAVASLAKPLGCYISKCGVTLGNPKRRIEQLSQARYAGLWGREGELIPLEGATNWRQLHLTPPIQMEMECKRRFATFSAFGDIHLQVPPKLPLADVDAAVDYVLRRRSLRAYLNSQRGQIRGAKNGVDPHGWFYTRYGEGDPAAVRELYLINPLRDGTWLLDAMERLGTYFHARAHEQGL